jgi:hypothetical protein
MTPYDISRASFALVVTLRAGHRRATKGQLVAIATPKKIIISTYSMIYLFLIVFLS